MIVLTRTEYHNLCNSLRGIPGKRPILVLAEVQRAVLKSIDVNSLPTDDDALLPEEHPDTESSSPNQKDEEL